MLPILFRIGNFSVRTYTVLVDLGLIAGLALAYWLWRRRGQPASALLDAATCALVGGILGGRGAFVAMNYDYFSQAPLEILTVWNGGVSFHGALIGGLLAVWIYTLAARKSFWDLADAAALGLTLGALFSWVGCLAAGCAYGAVGDGMLASFSPDVFGIDAQRFATQLVAIVFSVVVLAVLVWLARERARPGLIFAYFLLLYFGSQFVVEFFRGDETIWVGPLRLGQLIDGLLALTGLALLAFVLRRPIAEPAQAAKMPAGDEQLTEEDEPPAEAEPASAVVGIEETGVNQP
jgi:phosphatidylglycerol---prolipoprotein diacylglyceryl transferase